MKRSRSPHGRLFAGSAPLAVLAMATGAYAQAAPPAPANANPSNAIAEVVVTAQFRQQSLQKTPLAITAVNAQMLENRNQTSLADVTAQAPNVTLAPNGAAFGSSMVAFIRGIGQTDFNLALEPGVGIYVDDVYYPTLTGSLLDLLDLDRVEILRGPQGTLAGKNSIGGAIKLYSQKPTANDGGYIQGTYGSLNRMNARGAGNFTLIPDKLFVRVSASTENHDGYVTRVDYACTHPGSNVKSFVVGDGCTLGHDGDQHVSNGRLALRWLPTEKLEINLSGDVTDDNSGVQANTISKVSPDQEPGLADLHRWSQRPAGILQLAVPAAQPLHELRDLSFERLLGDLRLRPLCADRRPADQPPVGDQHRRHDRLQDRRQSHPEVDHRVPVL